MGQPHFLKGNIMLKDGIFETNENMVEYIISRAHLISVSNNKETIKACQNDMKNIIKSLNDPSMNYLVKQLLILERNRDEVYIRAISNGQVAEKLKEIVFTDERCKKLYDKLSTQTKNSKMGIIKRFLFIEKLKEMAQDISERYFIKKENYYRGSTEDVLVAQSINIQYLTRVKKFLELLSEADEKTKDKMFKSFAGYDKENGTHLVEQTRYILKHKEELMSFFQDIKKNCLAVDECVC